MTTSLLVLVLARQGFRSPPSDSRDLEPKTRPFIEIALTKNVPCVSVSEFEIREANLNKRYWIRVCRFTYKTEYWEEEKRWLKQVAGKDGWKVESKPNDELVLTRPVKHEKISSQTLRLHPGTISRNVDQPYQTRLSTAPAYIWFSLSERKK